MQTHRLEKVMKKSKSEKSVMKSFTQRLYTKRAVKGACFRLQSFTMAWPLKPNSPNIFGSLVELQITQITKVLNKFHLKDRLNMNNQ